MYVSGGDIDELYVKINRELSMLLDWFRANKLSLNESKTQYMLFTTKPTHNANNTISINNNDVSRVQHFKLLGITIDDKLKWNEHTRVINQRIVRALFAINKVKMCLPKSQLRMLYHAIVYPHLTYGITLWGSAPEIHKIQIKVTQKKIIRIINRSAFDAPSEPIFKSLNILNLDDIYKYTTTRYILQFLSKNLPVLNENLFQVIPDIHNRLTRQNKIYRLHAHRPRTT